MTVAKTDLCTPSLDMHILMIQKIKAAGSHQLSN